jgi:hypothetical protein
MTNKSLAVIKRIGNWYLMEHDMYIRIYRATKSPQLLLRFVPENLLLHEVAYQIMINGVGAFLYRDNKSIWPPLRLWIGSYSFMTIKQAWDEVNTLLLYRFEEDTFRRHDPKKVVRENCNKYSAPWENTSTTWEEEELHCRARTYDEVISKKQGNPLGRILDEGRA